MAERGKVGKASKLGRSLRESPRIRPESWWVPPHGPESQVNFALTKHNDSPTHVWDELIRLLGRGTP